MNVSFSFSNSVKIPTVFVFLCFHLLVFEQELHAGVDHLGLCQRDARERASADYRVEDIYVAGRGRKDRRSQVIDGLDHAYTNVSKLRTI